MTAYLRSAIEDQQILAVDLAKDCHLVGLLDDLVDLFIDTKVPRSVRIAAGSRSTRSSPSGPPTVSDRWRWPPPVPTTPTTS
ncbi:MAG: hypothetical protein M3083_10500 [Actinomycetota bacterium]|nr:hypothetical protein [Actinomycetota bacterium]